MKLFFGSDIIEFYCYEEMYDVVPKPAPAFKYIPEWFKKINPVAESSRDHFGCFTSTAKKCLPLLDAMSLGFVIPLATDVNIRTSNDGKHIEGSSGPFFNCINFHPLDQLGGKTSPTYPGPAVKFINPWFIKTAPGYSCLITSPINHFEPRFTCLSGVVDTDLYPRCINFPAVWNIRGFDGRVEAGTPLVTVIPIRRKDMVRETNVRKITEKEKNADKLMEKKQLTRIGTYTVEQRVPKR